MRIGGDIFEKNGYESDPDITLALCKRSKEFVEWMADALYFGYEANTGDGIRWGMELGAATENMRGFQGHASVAVPHGILVTWGTVMNGGFLVNRTARRFGNETEGYSEYALEVLKKPDGIAYVIFDRRILESIQKTDDVKKSMKTGAVKEGESIEELARRFELNPDALRETLDEFNQTAVNGKDAFGRTIFGERLTPPFCGVQVTGALFHTQGGLKVNVHAQVLDQRGIPIPNLYAGGGERPVLVIIDIQMNYVGEDVPIEEQLDRWPSGGGSAAWQAIRNIEKVRQAAKEAGIPGTQIVAELAPDDTDLVVDKSCASAFFGTPFISYLIKMKADTLIIVGGSTSGCVRATAVDAVTHNFNVAVLEDCVYDRITLSHKAGLLDLWMKYCDVLSSDTAVKYLKELKK